MPIISIKGFSSGANSAGVLQRFVEKLKDRISEVPNLFAEREALKIYLEDCILQVDDIFVDVLLAEKDGRTSESLELMREEIISVIHEDFPEVKGVKCYGKLFNRDGNEFSTKRWKT